MSSGHIARFVVFGVVAYCLGWLLYPLGVYFLLETIAFPESRWGPEGSRIVGQTLHPIAHSVIVGALSLILVFCAQRIAVTYSLLVSLGALSYFIALLWETPTLGVMEHALLIMTAGVLAGVVLGVPVGFGIANYRHVTAGLPITNRSWLFRVAAQRLRTYSPIGRVLFVLIMLAWTCIFFLGWMAPALLARILNTTQNKTILYALLLEWAVFGIAAIGGYMAWKRMVNYA